MADRRRRRRGRGGVAWLALAWVVALGMAAPVAVLAGGDGRSEPAVIVPGAPAPGESCPDTTPAPGESRAVCADVTGPDVGGTGGIDLGSLLPILAAAVVGGLLALVAVFYFASRRAAAPLAPADPGEWWTCHSCGKTNVVGSPRCFSCGTWQA